MAGLGEDDFEIGDIENFSSNKDEQFSHSTLVMTSMKKALDAGIREMHPGWFNTKTDRAGHTIKTYVDDTRKGFIESVKTCCMIMAADITDDKNNEASEYIDECLEDIEKKRIELAKIEEESWNKQPAGFKTVMNQKGIYNIQGILLIQN